MRYRSLRVGCLGRWSARLQTGFPVSGPTQEPLPRANPIPYAAITRCGGVFQTPSGRDGGNGDGQPDPSKRSYNPGGATADPLTRHRFGLHPVRSPLLRVSFTRPPATEMFQFTGFPPPQGGPCRSRGVAPFGNPGINAYSPLPQAYRCDVPSFVGTQRQGIHRVLIMSSLQSRLKGSVRPRPSKRHGTQDTKQTKTQTP